MVGVDMTTETSPPSSIFATYGMDMPAAAEDLITCVATTTQGRRTAMEN
jgi:hypothetical protein